MPKREDESAGERERRQRREREGRGRPEETVKRYDEPIPEDDGYEWPGPQPYFGQGPTPADNLFERGTKGWKQALDPRRKWVGDELWRAQVGQGLNLSDLSEGGAVDRFLRGLGISDEQGGGRHLRNLVLGRLPGEGFGPSGYRGTSHFEEQYMPEWKRGFDQAVQGGHLTRDWQTGLWVNAGKDPNNPEWYNSFGERVAPPYAGRWRSQYDQDMSNREDNAPPITFENPPGGPPAVTPPPSSNVMTSASRTSPALSGYSSPVTRPSTTMAQPQQQQSQFYTSPTPPSGIGINFNLQPQQQKKQSAFGQKHKPVAPQPKPAAGWQPTWA